MWSVNLYRILPFNVHKRGEAFNIFPVDKAITVRNTSHINEVNIRIVNSNKRAPNSTGS